MSKPWYWLMRHIFPVHNVEMTIRPPDRVSIVHDGPGVMRFTWITSKGVTRHAELLSIDTLELTFKDDDDGT